MSAIKIYFDNAATSWPKPESVLSAMEDFMRNVGANPGRSGHSMSVDSARIVFETREELADLFGMKSSERVVFTNNATHAINLALKGILKSGDNVITSSMEHNSVIRPLRFLEKSIGITVTIVDIENIKGAINENTKLVAVQHASNVTGTIMPIREIGAICRQKKIFFLVDAAQSAGLLPIDLQKDNIDLLAFTGHKSLMGPQGIGGLCLGDRVQLSPLLHGGTGSKSESETHPDFLPDQLEAGTLNTVGIAGLRAGICFVKEKNILQHEQELAKHLIEGLCSLKGIKIYGGEERVGVVSFNIDGISPSDIGAKLDRDHNIMVRVGLHCSPLAHKTIGTFPQGTVRVSFSFFNQKEEVNRLIEAL